MAKARKITQLVVITPNEVGTLTTVCKTIAGAGGVISHVCASALGDDARFMLNVRDGDSARSALEKLNYEVSEAEVLEVELENKGGTLEPIARRLGEADVDIEFLYGTTADGRKATCILSTNDNERALALLNG